MLLFGAEERMEWQQLGSCIGCKVSSMLLLPSPAVARPSRVDRTVFQHCLWCQRGASVRAKGLEPGGLGCETV